MKTKHVQYETQGTCSKMIDVTADENNVIQQVFFLGDSISTMSSNDSTVFAAVQKELHALISSAERLNS